MDRRGDPGTWREEPLPVPFLVEQVFQVILSAWGTPAGCLSEALERETTGDARSRRALP
jgi:hypothetical protein